MYWCVSKPLRPTVAFFFGLAVTTAALLTVGLFWWVLPAVPRLRWQAAGAVERFVFSADGAILAAVATDETEHASLTLYQTASGEPLAVRPIHWKRTRPGEAVSHTPEVWLSADGRTVIFQEPFADDAGRLLLWNSANGAEPMVLPEAWEPLAMSWPYLATAAFPTESPYAGVRPFPEPVKLWDLRTGAAQPIRLPPLRVTTRIAVGPDGTIVLLQFPEQEEESATVSRLLDGREILALPDYAGGLDADHGGYLYTESDQGLQLWDLAGRKGRVIARTEEADGWLNADGTRVVTSGWVPDGEKTPDGREYLRMQTNLWDVAASPARRLATFASAAPSFSPDGKWLKTGGDMGNVQVWNAASGAELASVRILGGSMTTRFAPDSRSLAGFRLPNLDLSGPIYSSWTDIVRDQLGIARPIDAYDGLQVFSLETGRMLADLGRCNLFAYAPDGKAIVLARDGGRIEIWDIPAHRLWWIEYGLPVLAALVVVLAIRRCVRFRNACRPTD